MEWQLHNLRLLNRRYKKKRAALDGANIEDGKKIKATNSIGREEEKVNV